MRLRVLSLNVWALPPPVGRDVHARLSLILRDLAGLDWDIGLFQEVWTDEAREQMIAGGHRLGYPHSWTTPGPARGGSGLLALSRLPIRSSRFRRFSLCGLPQRLTHMDYYSGKGVARIDVELDGQSVAVFNTHLHARYAPATAIDEYQGHRTAEVIEIAKEIRGVSDPVVAAGDFNMRDSSDEYRVLEGLTGLVDDAAALDAREPTATLQNPYRLGRGARHESRIDYVFSRAGRHCGATPVRAQRFFDQPIEVAGEIGAYSDHAGVWAEIEIGGPGAVMEPPSDPAVALARELLARGRAQTEVRRRHERIAAAASVGAGVGSGWASTRPTFSRRRFLRYGLRGAAALGALWGGGLLTLSEVAVPRELQAYDAAESLLGSLR